MWEITFCQQVGNKHRYNQDALFNGESVFQYQLKKAETFVCERSAFCVGVADGISNSPKSQLASRFVMEQLAECSDFNARWLRGVQQRLSEKFALSHFGSSTTFVGAELTAQGKVKLLNVGDSRAYKISANGEWQQLSVDHTILSELKEQGLADEQTEYAELYRGLSDCLVADSDYQDFRIFSSETFFQKGDFLLLCSDCLTDHISLPRCQQIWARYANSRDRLTICRKIVKSYPLYDDFSAVLCQFIQE